MYIVWLRSYFPGALVFSSEAVGLVATFISLWMSLDALELISGVFSYSLVSSSESVVTLPFFSKYYLMQALCTIV